MGLVKLPSTPSKGPSSEHARRSVASVAPHLTRLGVGLGLGLGRSLAANANNQVAIAKVDGALVALVALVHEGSAAGKGAAAGRALKSLSKTTGIKASLLKLGCASRDLE